MLPFSGEKEAVALLMAIFRYQPSPSVCRTKWTRLLREMSTQTQFIVITHSKKTMKERTDVWLTRQESGASKLALVKFQPAAA